MDTSLGGGFEMTLFEPITDEEYVGYLTAMIGNDPWGDPAADLTGVGDGEVVPHTGPVETPGS